MAFGDFLIGSYLTAGSISNLRINPSGLTGTVPALQLVEGPTASLAWTTKTIVLPTLENVPAVLGAGVGRSFS